MDYRSPEAKKWQEKTAELEAIASSILYLTSPALYKKGMDVIDRIKAGYPQANHANKTVVPVEVKSAALAPHALNWASPFSGTSVIVNRTTPDHRDGQGNIAAYDVLTSLGTHKGAIFRSSDLDGTFSYNPGTFEVIAGRLLKHGCGAWEEGERICYARFFRDRIHSDLGVEVPPWAEISHCSAVMSKDFAEKYVKKYSPRRSSSW